MNRAAAAFLACLFLSASDAAAADTADSRTWTEQTSGRTLEGSLVRQDATRAWIRRADGREIAIEKTRLSPADLEFLQKQPAAAAPAAAAPAAGAPSAAGAPRPGVSIFKTVKIDRAAWQTSSEVFHAGGVAFTQRLQTPHFLVFATAKIKPDMLAAYAESAERTFADCVNDLPGLASVLKEKRFALWLVNTEPEHQSFGNWLRNRSSISPDWSTLAIASAPLSDETCEELKVLPNSREYRLDKFTTTAHRSLTWPNRLHFLASDVLYRHLFDIGTGEPEADGSRRSFHTLRIGYAFFKEWQIAGKIDTALSVGGADIEGFQNGRRWADAVRRVLKNPAGHPTLDELLKTPATSAQPIDIACAFGLMQFLNADPRRFRAFDSLLASARTSEKMPTTEEIAKALGFASPAALESEWIAFMRSDAFR